MGLLLFASKIINGIATIIAINAAKNIYDDGLNDSVPSLLTITSAPERTSLPINGPTTPGTNTCETILTPCSLPAFPLGVLSLIVAPNTAIPARYPLIISSEPINTSNLFVKINSIKYPSINHISEKVIEKEKPFLS